jgi:hypothetical protein
MHPTPHLRLFGMVVPRLPSPTHNENFTNFFRSDSTAKKLLSDPSRPVRHHPGSLMANTTTGRRQRGEKKDVLPLVNIAEVNPQVGGLW